MGTVATASSPRSKAGRLLYGALFVFLLPVGLTLWAHGAAATVHVPPYRDEPWGAGFALAGLFAICAGMLALWRRGGGLPMNAYPPPRFVASGIYAFVPHPIYSGFVLVCGGIALYQGSAAGLWLITPAVSLGCAALVLGYEMPDLHERFGTRGSSIWLAAESVDAPTFVERIRIYFVAILPWFFVYEWIGYLGPSSDAVDTYFRFERSWPVLAGFEPIYFSTYVGVLIFPFAAPAQGLRRFAMLSYMAMATIFPLFLFLPFYVQPRPFEAVNFIGRLFLLEHSPISGAGAFPSFHVAWTCIVAVVLSRETPRARVAASIWVALVGVSCIATGMHSIADVVAGYAAFLLIANLHGIWRGILRAAEVIANSWREWRIGPVRIVNHGAYAGAAAAVGIFLIDSFVGPGKELLSFGICIGALVGAAFWAQWVEGSPALLRPLGFYGGMIGSMIGATIAFAVGVPLWGAFAAICVAAPWIQGLGRLRCLVQGCCHGRPVKTVAGIRYTQPLSRVCRIAHLDGVPIHATPVYSILWNFVVGAALLRLVTLHVSAAFLCGVYLLLSGSGRFVEEAYRGEPQTRIVAGLRFYQWIAIVSVIAGAVFTCVHGASPLPMLPVRISSAGPAMVCGVLTWFVSGVDFPDSSRRFARLT